jgi:dTDP-4-dehydrorhamnose reductase
MIVGHGDIAQILTDRPDRLYFVSGVSKSLETRESEFQRERDLLLEQPRDLRLVYMSSLAIFYSDTPYTRHKRAMELMIQENFEKWTILRLGTTAFGTNPNTIVNFMRNRIENNEPYEVQDVYRYVVSKEDLLHWVDMIPDWNAEMSITGTRMKVAEIVEAIKEGEL